MLRLPEVADAIAVTRAAIIAMLLLAWSGADGARADTQLPRFRTVDEPLVSERVIEQGEWASELAFALGISGALRADPSAEDVFGLLCPERAEREPESGGRRAPIGAPFREAFDLPAARLPGESVRVVANLPATALYALTVTGDATFNGTTSNLTAGQITLQGNFSQASTAQSFSPSGTHSTVFNGTGAQTIFFTNAGATSSRFQELTISNAAGVSFTSSNAFVNGTATLASGAGSVTGTTVTIAGDLVDTPGSAWQVTNTTFSGTPTLPLNMATNLTFTGAATLGGDLNLLGNLTVSGGSANLTLSGRTVAVT
ncbi:MAG: hypothetical protein IH827_07095, partial [Myxococcales bacterium]|nr:hypothetical protein [Myxococcales bacterium]